ncbi:MAG: hypothetical protein KME30_00960 [Iphinoe sp. HA4291-MV1]|nr:hypothetical protein [Iphinoe sp. HA4291-MV1]
MGTRELEDVVRLDFALNLHILEPLYSKALIEWEQVQREKVQSPVSPFVVRMRAKGIL